MYVYFKCDMKAGKENFMKKKTFITVNSYICDLY